MKKLYSLPVADVCLFCSEDVLTTSVLGNFLTNGKSLSDNISATPGEGDELNLNW